jgi:hypothetical protein
MKFRTAAILIVLAMSVCGCKGSDNPMPAPDATQEVKSDSPAPVDVTPLDVPAVAEVKAELPQLTDVVPVQEVKLDVPKIEEVKPASEVLAQ